MRTNTGVKIFTAVAVSVLVIFTAALVFHKNMRWSIRYLLSRDPQAGSTPMAQLPPCPGCNLILISLDTLRADRMGYLGSPEGLTPNLDRIAARSAVFENAFTNAWFTTPSHMTVFTSLYTQTHQTESERIRLNVYETSGPGRHALDPKFKTLAEVLQAAGYATYWKAPLHLKYFNFKDGFARGFESIDGPPFNRVPQFSGNRPFAAEALKPLVGGTKPVFMFLHSYMTHLPYFSDDLKNHGQESKVSYSQRVLDEFSYLSLQSPLFLINESDYDPNKMSDKKIAEIADSCSDMWDLSKCFASQITKDTYWHAVGLAQAARAMRILREGNPHEDFHTAELNTYIEAYNLSVKTLDEQVGQMWSALESSGALKNTVVMFISDHGEELMDHNGVNHTNFYDHTERVPVMIFHPKLAGPVRVPQLYSLVDVMPTLLEILGVPGPPQMQGHVPWKVAPKFVFGYTLGTEVVRSGSWKLMRRYSGEDEIYYLPLDPGEHQDLMGSDNPFVERAYKELVLARKNWEADQAL